MLSILIGLFGASQGYFQTKWSPETAGARDISQVVYASRAMLAGRDPYLEIGPGRTFQWENNFYYPLTAAVATVPLTVLRPYWAEAVFLGLGVGLFAWALMARGYWPLLAFASVAADGLYRSVQWSPMLAAGLVMPWLSVLWAVKPNIGAALFVARPSRRALWGGIVLLAISLAIQPQWPFHWRQALAETTLTTSGDGVPYLSPVMLPFGPFVLLALLRWRRWEARLLIALACVPQTVFNYEAIPLFLIPAGAVECIALWLVSWGTVPLMRALGPFDHAVKLPWLSASGTTMVLCIYLPCVLMVLRRPNAGPVPVWLERWIAGRSLPRWLVGVPDDRAVAE